MTDIETFKILQAFPRTPFTTGIGSKVFKGDVFYSDIYNYVKQTKKKNTSTYYAQVCDVLQKNGYYIHS